MWNFYRTCVVQMLFQIKLLKYKLFLIFLEMFILEKELKHPLKMFRKRGFFGVTKMENFNKY